MNNAVVKTIRHKNVLGEESQYIEISNEKGKVLIKSGNSTLKKLEDIGLTIGTEEAPKQGKGNEMVGKK